MITCNENDLLFDDDMGLFVECAPMWRGTKHSFVSIGVYRLNYVKMKSDREDGSTISTYIHWVSPFKAPRGEPR